MVAVMTVSNEHFILLFGVLVLVGLFVSFEVAAVLGALSVVALGIWARHKQGARECPRCGSKGQGSAGVCERCGFEFQGPAGASM